MADTARIGGDKILSITHILKIGVTQAERASRMTENNFIACNV
jgi:hypothetical protein